MSGKEFRQHIQASIESRETALAARFDAVDERVRDVMPRVMCSNAVGAGLGGKEAAKRLKVVKDSFSMPPEDHAGIETVRLLAAARGSIFTKSEVVRAALCYFRSSDEEMQLASLNTVFKIGPGRKK